MPKKLEHYQDFAKSITKANRGRDLMYAAISNMWHGEWSLPDKMQDEIDWIHKVVSSDPHDAVRAGTRMLSSVDPRIKLAPLGPNEETRAAANKIEKSLLWLFLRANGRGRASVLRDVVQSALLYDEVVAQVIFLPHQIKAFKSFKGDTKRLEFAKRFGPYAINVESPRNVYVQYSDYMPEAVVKIKSMELQAVESFWGDKADKVKDLVDDPFKNVVLYDYMDLEDRVVWASAREGEDGVEILREAHGLPFLPWVAVVGGTNLEEDEEHKRIPLLYSVYQTGQYDTQNIIRTLMVTEAIAYSAAPRFTTDSEDVEIDYGTPNKIAYVPPGRELKELKPPITDPALREQEAHIAQAIAKSTVPSVIQGGEFPAGTAFATLNLATQSGLKSLNPYKELAEQAMAEIFRQMLYWIDHTKETVSTFGSTRGDLGEQYSIKKDDFDIENLYIEVELTADAASDRMQRINAGSMLHQQLKFPLEKVYDELGETDSRDAIDMYYEERTTDVAKETELQKIAAASQLEIELEAKRAHAKLDREILQAMQQGAPPEQEGLAAALGGQKSEGGGQGFNPDQGGTPPALLDPTQTREGVTGRDFLGGAV